MTIIANSLIQTTQPTGKHIQNVLDMNVLDINLEIQNVLDINLEIQNVLDINLEIQNVLDINLEIQNVLDINVVNGPNGYPGRPDEWKNSSTNKIGEKMGHTKAEDDNRSNQLNPNNPAYWKSRKYPGRPDEWKELTEEKPSTDAGK